MKLIIIDNFDSFTWNLYQQFSSCINELKASELEIIVVRNNSKNLDRIRVEETLAIVIGPGPGRPEDSGKSIEIFQKFKGLIPFFGVCLGHQLIAQHFGAIISKASFPMHGKTSELKNISGTLFKDIETEKIVVARYHSLIVENNNFPTTLSISSYSEEGEIMSFENVELNIYGIQFHPESFLTPKGSVLIKNFIDITLNSNKNDE